MSHSALFDAIRTATGSVNFVRRLGTVRHVGGLAVIARGPCVAVGEACLIRPESSSRAPIDAEVVAVNGDEITLMTYGAPAGIRAGDVVESLGSAPRIGVGQALLGRVIDAHGRPLDGLETPRGLAMRPLAAAPVNPMHRPRISRPLQTGVRAIDGLLTLGQGQRVGIFAGSGVGKSTLLGMIARHVRADVNVIALIGERGREVAEFVDKHLGAEGLARSVVVVAAADEPPLTRLRAARAAFAIAEHFRELGRQVLLTVDSITRYAMARREVGLSAGEPPTARGYTPAVFTELPELCERCGTAPGGGSITALMTVLVEGDDMNEPIADTLRATLDGHIVLSRVLAHRGRYPAIDPLQSASRVMPDVVDAAHRERAIEVIRLLSLLERNRPLVELGAYEAGSNAVLDAALSREAELEQFLRQSDGGVAMADSVRALERVLAPVRPDASGQVRT